MSFWKKVDKSHNLFFIEDDDECIYAREYKAGMGFNAGETNDLIYNFKKKPGSNGWSYRQRDVKRFADEIASLFSERSRVAITAVPSSKKKDHAEYTNRFEDAFSELLKKCPKLVVEWPIDLQDSVTPAHDGGSRRPQEIARNFIWEGFEHGEPNTLVVFDDVVTTGSHFRAVSDFLRSNGFQGRIVGVFWARAVHPSAEEVFDLVE